MRPEGEEGEKDGLCMDEQMNVKERQREKTKQKENKIPAILQHQDHNLPEKPRTRTTWRLYALHQDAKLVSSSTAVPTHLHPHPLQLTD